MKTSRGEYEAGQLAICAGPWVEEALANLNLPFRVERQVMAWFEPRVGVDEFLPGNSQSGFGKRKPARIRMVSPPSTVPRQALKRPFITAARIETARRKRLTAISPSWKSKKSAAAWPVASPR